MRTGLETTQRKSYGSGRKGDVAYLLDDVFHDENGNPLSDMVGCLGPDDAQSICVFLTDPFQQSIHNAYNCWILLTPSGIVTMFHIINKLAATDGTQWDEMYL